MGSFPETYIDPNLQCRTSQRYSTVPISRSLDFSKLASNNANQKRFSFYQSNMTFIPSTFHTLRFVEPILVFLGGSTNRESTVWEHC